MIRSGRLPPTSGRSAAASRLSVQLYCAAPARPFRGCAGALAFLVLCLTGCENSPLRREQKLDLGNDTITLEKGTIHDVRVTSAAGEFAPASLEARTGDVVRYVTADSRTHVLSFDGPSLPAAARQVFESKHQLRSPPLVVQGAAWIITLEGVPAGTYTYRCESHNFTGTIVVK